MSIGNSGEESVNYAAKTAYELVKLSGDALRKLLEVFSNSMENSPGKRSLKNLLSTGKELKTVEFNKENLSQFSKQAKKYGIQFSVVGERNEDKKCVVFKAEDLDRMEKVLSNILENSINENTKEEEMSVDNKDDSKENIDRKEVIDNKSTIEESTDEKVGEWKREAPNKSIDYKVGINKKIKEIQENKSTSHRSMDSRQKSVVKESVR